MDPDRNGPVRPVGVGRLRPEEVLKAYALVQVGHGGITLDAWCAFARPLAARCDRRAAGLLAARGRAGYLLGLAAYRTGFYPGRGRVLVADPVLALDVLDDGYAAARALAEALDGLARRTGCRALYAVVEPSHAAVVAAFEAQGHRREAVILRRPTDGRGTPARGAGNGAGSTLARA